MGTEIWQGDLDGIAKRRYLRVLVAPNKIGFYFNGSQMQGAIYDTVREFETFLNKKVNTGKLPINGAFLPVSRERLIPMLAEGKGDLVATLAGVSEKRQEAVIHQLRLEAAAQGYDPNKWFNNVEVIASKEIGRETVQYVSNIYKYYLAYELVTKRDAEWESAIRMSKSRGISAK